MRGIYILPNLFTSANLACGFCSILKSVNGEYREAAWLILLANVFDILDGRIARWTKATTQFGVQFDSLADLVAFGVAPGLLVIQYSQTGIPFWGAIAGFAFVLCGAARLARFNVQAAVPAGGPSAFFVGCPIPAAATMLVTSILVDMRLPVTAGARAFWIVTVVAAFMMVSTVPYPSMKKNRDDRVRSALTRRTLVALVMLGLIVTYQEFCLFLMAMIYFLSGPAWKVGRLLARFSLVRRVVERMASDIKAKE